MKLNAEYSNILDLFDLKSFWKTLGFQMEIHR